MEKFQRLVVILPILTLWMLLGPVSSVQAEDAAQPTVAPETEAAPEAAEEPAVPAASEVVNVKPAKVFEPPKPKKGVQVTVSEKKAEEPKREANVFTSVGKYIEIYGNVNLDLIYDSGRTNSGNWMLFLKRNGGKHWSDDAGAVVSTGDKNDNEFQVNPRGSRLGLNIKGQEIKEIGAKISAKAEIDFFGGDVSTGDWKAVPRWRHLYFAVDWGWFEFLAGQTFDVFSPMYPASIDNGATWWMGNTGGRRPQARLTFKPHFDDQGVFIGQLAVARPSTVSGHDNDGDGNNDGEDSGIPQIQWRLAVDRPLWTQKSFVVGISGHYQQEKTQTPIGIKQNDTFNSWSVIGELSMPILEELVLRGEVYYGVNLKDIYGGALQGVNTYRGEEIAALGFWADLTYTPLNWLKVAAGFAMDDPEDDDLPNPETKTDNNLFVWANQSQYEAARWLTGLGFLRSTFTLGGGFSISVQYTYAFTEYRLIQSNPQLVGTGMAVKTARETAVDHRAQTTFCYKF